MKKTLSLLTAGVLLSMTMAGCSTQTPTTTTTASAATTVQPTAAATATVAATVAATTAATAAKPDTFIADRQIEGRVFMENDGAQLPADQLNNPIAKKIKDLTGISINWKSTGANDGLQELTLALAAHDVPEVTSNYLNNSGRPEASVLFKAAREGMFEDVAPYLANTKELSKYNDKNFLPADTYDNIVHRAEFNGEVYLIHMNIDRPKPASDVVYDGQDRFPYIRWDIMKDLGKTPADIKTWDDLLALCQSIQDKNYTDDNGKEIAVIGPRVWGGDINSSMYKAFNWGNGNRFGVDTDGKIKHVTETEWAWKQVNAMRTLLAKGYLHPEYFTMENSRAEEGELNGSWAITPQGKREEQRGDKSYVQLTYLQNWEGKSTVYYGAGREGDGTWEIIKGTKNPEEIVKFADFLMTIPGKTIWKYGIEGQTYDLTNGQPRIKKEIYDECQQDQATFKDKWGFVVGDDAFQFGLLGKTDKNDIVDFGEKKAGIGYDPKEAVKKAQDAYSNNPNLQALSEDPDAVSFIGDPAMKDIATTLDPVMAQSEWAKVFVQAVMAKNETEAKKILSNYSERLAGAGLKKFEDFLQQKYDADPNSVRFYNLDTY